MDGQTDRQTDRQNTSAGVELRFAAKNPHKLLLSLTELEVHFLHCVGCILHLGLSLDNNQEINQQFEALVPGKSLLFRDLKVPAPAASELHIASDRTPLF